MFNFSFDKRTIYVIIIILVLFALAQYISNPGELLTLAMSVPGVLIAITFHEFAHGFAAYKLGDDTAKLEGRLNLNAIYKFVGIEFIYSRVGYIIMRLLEYTIAINIGLGVFNLIPLPPLDGSKVIMPFLPYNAKEWFRNNEQIFYIIFVVIWITGIAGTIITPAISAVSTGIMYLGKLIFGL